MPSLRKSTEVLVVSNQVFGIPGWAVTLQDTQAVQCIARAIGKRAARLAGTALGAMIHQSGKLEHIDPLTLPRKDSADNSLEGRTDSVKREEVRAIDIGVDGSVVELYPRFEEYMRSAIKVIDKIGPEGEQRIRIGLAKHGSSIGTAIIALLAAEQTDVAGK